MMNQWPKSLLDLLRPNWEVNKKGNVSDQDTVLFACCSLSVICFVGHNSFLFLEIICSVVSECVGNVLELHCGLQQWRCCRQRYCWWGIPHSRNCCFWSRRGAITDIISCYNQHWTGISIFLWSRKLGVGQHMVNMTSKTSPIFQCNQ